MNGRRLIAGFGLLVVVTGAAWYQRVSVERTEQLIGGRIEPATVYSAVYSAKTVRHRAEAAQTATPAAPEQIDYGKSVKRTFTPNASLFTFSFQGQAGDVITLTMVADRGDSVDPALVLIGPNGVLVARNDDSFDVNFGVTNARLVNFPIPTTGTYTIQAMHSTDAVGNFTLTLRGTRARKTDNMLTYGDSADGNTPPTPSAQRTSSRRRRAT